MAWWKVLLMCVGFFGIQHGFEIQFANMSAIYQKLGVPDWLLSLLWLPAPLMGFFVAPIVGNLSDKSWMGWLGRRRGFSLLGALLSTGALIWMPNCSTIAGAVICLCVLDLSINVCMSPSRALLVDKLPKERLAFGFSVQSLMIGVGGTLATWIASFDWVSHYPMLAQLGGTTMHWQFYLCAAVFLVAILITVISTPEDRHLNKGTALDAALAEPEEAPTFVKPSFSASVTHWLADMRYALTHMPEAMRRLCVVQFFTWMGLFCFFMYYNIAVAKGVYHASDPSSAAYQTGVLAASQSKVYYQAVSTGFSLLLPLMAMGLGRVWMHSLGLLVAGLGLLVVCFMANTACLPWAMAGMGLGWCCILTLPFAMVGEFVPQQRSGVYMGLFNLFIVVPEIIAALFFGLLVDRVFHGNELAIIGLGGGFMIIAAILMLRMLPFNRPATA
jgi:maltose/moltooligosaccharide transporter